MARAKKAEESVTTEGTTKKGLSDETKAKISEALKRRKTVVAEALDSIAPKLVADESKIKESGNVVTLNGYFKVEKGTFEILKHNIGYGINTMLIGATGTGKTEVVANIAKVFDVPLTIFDMGTMTDPVMGLVGTHRWSTRSTTQLRYRFTLSAYSSQRLTWEVNIRELTSLTVPYLTDSCSSK